MLRDKAILITGAGRGFGRASALAMAKEGASLVILSRTAPEVEETAGLIKNIGRSVLPIVGDVSEPRDVQRTVEQTISAFGRIDVLMNNASVVGPIMYLHDVTDQE